jgi:AcrR family transcriptional regulator
MQEHCSRFWSEWGRLVTMPRETRQEARSRITAELMAAARRQLAEVGAAGLSLREVAREIGMVSSAVYRYVESRDDLLTRLIIESYDSLGATAERASARALTAAPDDDLGRWATTAHAIRRWSLTRPHEHLLLYGSPVPGYAAPEDTIGPATRVTFALIGIVGDAASAGRLASPAGPPADVTAELADELVALAGTIEQDIPATPDAVLAVLTAWTQMFGLIGFEITNQTRNMVTDHTALFDAIVRRLGHHIGLR